jgi:arginine/lysine/ornithine decarboxylase
MQRAFATGHMGMAAAMANFVSDCLGGVLLQVMTGRAQESGVVPLKPGIGRLMAGDSFFAPPQ